MGTSKAMEGSAILDMLTNLFSDDIIVGMLIQDGDASAKKSVHEIFPDAEVRHCSHHIGRNFRKALEKQQKIRSLTERERSALAEKHGDLADWELLKECRCGNRHKPHCGLRCLSPLDTANVIFATMVKVEVYPGHQNKTMSGPLRHREPSVGRY